MVWACRWPGRSARRFPPEPEQGSWECRRSNTERLRKRERENAGGLITERCLAGIAAYINNESAGEGELKALCEEIQQHLTVMKEIVLAVVLQMQYIRLGIFPPVNHMHATT